MEIEGSRSCLGTTGQGPDIGASQRFAKAVLTQAD